jgi:myo-inositol-1(or 4)-monophosphatase
MTQSHIDKLRVAERAARAGAEVLLQHFGHATVHEKESTQNVVSQADWASEQRITQLILESFPQHSLLREETLFEGDLLSEQLWVVDPLDATNNYVHGIPHFCISIAFVQRGVPQVGVVYDPMRDEMFRAVRGEGAWLNDRPIHVAQPEGLTRSIIATGFYYDRGIMMERTLDAIRTLFHHNIRGMRRMGGAALDLSWTACGRYAGYFEYQLAPWDYAAGWLLVEEAGGTCFDRTAAPLRLGSGSVIASCPAIREEFVRLVAWPVDSSAPP